MGQVALVAEAQSVQIVENIAEDLVVTVGRKRIERVLVNLFINTLDVMPGGGTIRISAIPNAIRFWSRFAIPGQGSIL